MSQQLPPLRFITSNPHKAAEVERLLGSSVTRIDLDLPEIQAETFEAIARAKFGAACLHAQPPLAVEDVSLELHAFQSFPGPYVKWLIAAAGGEGLAAMVRGASTNAATARCIVVASTGGDVVIAEGSVDGVILDEPRGARQFGWDAWFQPEGSTRTYGEMSPEEKREISHRSIAWQRMRILLQPT